MVVGEINGFGNLWIKCGKALLNCLGPLVVDSSVIWSLVSIFSYLPSCTILSWIDVTEYD